jgi:beta-mannanase
MTTRTATVTRYHCYGTPQHHLSVSYRGETLRWATHDPQGYYTGNAYADMVDYGQESIEAAKDHARKQGFTHIRFAGEWRTKPRGGKL